MPSPEVRTQSATVLTSRHKPPTTTKAAKRNGSFSAWRGGTSAARAAEHHDLVIGEHDPPTVVSNMRHTADALVELGPKEQDVADCVAIDKAPQRVLIGVEREKPHEILLAVEVYARVDRRPQPRIVAVHEFRAERIGVEHVAAKLRVVQVFEQH